MKKNILLVDDDINVLISTKLLLEAMGHEVKSSEGGYEALELLTNESENIDVVLLDIMMPDLTGDLVMEELQEQIKQQKFQIIIQSGQMDENMKEKIFRLGAKDYIAKPYNYTSLKNTLEKYIR